MWNVLRDRNDLKVLTGCAYFIPNSVAHQKPCHRGYERNRAGLRVRFVLSHDTIFLYAPIAAPERHRAPKDDSVGRRRIADDLSRPNSRRKVAHIPQRDCRLPPSFINVLDLLRRPVRLSHRCGPKARHQAISDACARGRDRRFSPAFCRGAIRRPPCPDRPDEAIRRSAHPRDLVANVVELHSVLRSSGSPNFRMTFASPKSPMAGSPVRLKAIRHVKRSRNRSF